MTDDVTNDQHKTNPLLTSGSHISYWTDDAAAITLNPLRENLETEVVIIGGGLSGISIAYALSKEGKKVVVIEDGLIGSGETGRTTAHLTSALEERYFEYEKMYDEKTAGLLAESHQAAIDFIERTVREEQIDCDFERMNGYLFLHPSDKEENLGKELAAANRAGLSVRVEDHTPGMTLHINSICFENQAQFHPLKYINALAAIIERNGGKIYTGTHADVINSEGITTETGFMVKAEHVVVATNVPVNNRFAMSFNQIPYRTYVIGGLVPKGDLPRALWWDSGDYDRNPDMPPYHYVRLQPYNDAFDLLICGGEDHPTGNLDKPEPYITEEERYSLLEGWTRHHFPVGEIIYRWSGQVMQTLDHIGFIGRNPFDKNNVYIVTGDNGDGMTNGTIAAILIPDLIAGRENPWETIYRPSRFKLKEGAQAFKHVIQNTLASFRKKPEQKDAESLFSVGNGEAKIMTIEGEKCGVYRDENGLLSIVSATCTHLGCSVNWNSDERTWDCPCHGSRFSPEGKVINGPANSDLPAHRETS
jgi:glycine/D-amino acid oxidase-like deaminating enzyme/nitrite reductase/ring-hydroxylating ferredoxin subunit